MTARVGRRRRPRHCGPPLCLLLLLMVTGSRPQVTSVSSRTWTGIEPRDMPTSEVSCPSLLACVRLCAVRDATGGCAALYYEAGWCRLYQNTACQPGGKGLRETLSTTDRYTEIRQYPALFPTDDLCSLLSPPAADWTLNGHLLPGTVDVWTSGDVWGDVWKRLTHGQCEVSLAATVMSPTDQLTISVATALDKTNRTLKFVASFSSRVIYHHGETTTGWGSTSEGALQSGRQLTPLRISWCEGQLRMYSAGVLAVTRSQNVPGNLPFILLSSTGVARWRLGPQAADPWTVEPEGWSNQRSYNVAPHNAIWRRIPTSTNASVQFRCTSEDACRVFFRESMNTSLQANVKLVADVKSRAGIGNGTHNYWQPGWWTGWANADQPHWFRVEFDSGSVAIYEQSDAEGMTSLIHSELLETNQWFSRVPQTVQYVGLGSDSHPATFWVYEYDEEWGQELGFTVGTGLVTEEEAESF